MSWDRACCMSTASSSTGSASSSSSSNFSPASLTREYDLPPPPSLQPPISSLFMFSSSDEQVTNEREEPNVFLPQPPIFPNYHHLYSPVFSSRHQISDTCQCNSHSSQMASFDISSTFQTPFIYEQYLTSLKSEQSEHLPYLFDNIIYPQPCSPPSPTNDAITYYQLDQANTTTTIINKHPPRSHIQPITYQQLSLVEPPSSNIPSKIPLVKRFFYDSNNSNTTTTTTTIIATTPLVNNINHDQTNLPYARLDSNLFGTYEIWQERTLVGRRSNRREIDVNMGFSSVVSRIHFELLLIDGIEFHLKCLSKNGIFINNNYAKMSSITVLSKQCTLRFPSTDICISFISLLNNTSNSRISTDNLSRHGSIDISQRPLSSCTSIETVPSQQHVIYLGINQQTQTKFEQQSTAPLTINIPNTFLSSSSSIDSSSFSTGSCNEQMKYSEENSTIQHSSFGSSSSMNIKCEPNDISPIVNSPNITTRIHSTENDHLEHNHSKNTTKPPFSYAQLIVQAILSAPDKQMTLSQIYNFISSQYPYYEANNRGWQNSIRHNLSLNRYFIRLARKDHESGKGSFWRLDKNCEEKLIDHAFRHRKQRRNSMHSNIKIESEEFSSPKDFLLTDLHSSNSSRSISPIRSNTFKRKHFDDDDDEIEDLLNSLVHSIQSPIIIITDNQRSKRPKI